MYLSEEGGGKGRRKPLDPPPSPPPSPFPSNGFAAGGVFGTSSQWLVGGEEEGKEEKAEAGCPKEEEEGE